MASPCVWYLCWSAKWVPAWQRTVDSAFVLHSIVNEYLEQGEKLYTFFIDYSKAFDYIVHDNLWYKLLNLGVRGKKIIDIIRSMYSQVRTKVFNDNKKYETFTYKLGVRQGDCLSTFLFSMYVNDLESHLTGRDAGVSIFDVNFLLLLYAGDVLYIIPGKYRIALTRLIVCSHRLSVETGRWERPVVQYESILCHLSHKLDNECHFLLECDRNVKRMRRYYWFLALMYKCIQLLSTNKRKTVRLLGKFVYLAFRTVQ